MVLIDIFDSISEWASANLTGAIIATVVSFLGGFLAKHGVTKTLDSISKRGKVITKKIGMGLIEGGETFLAGSHFFEKVDEMIKDDYTIDQNSMKEAIKAGKEVYIEGKDVIAIFKPKKELKTIGAAENVDHDSTDEVEKEKLSRRTIRKLKRKL